MNMKSIKDGARVFACLATIIMTIASCQKESMQQEAFTVDQSISDCRQKLAQTIKNFNESEKLPRSISEGQQHWSGSSINSWTSGFYPGILWTMYELTGEEIWAHHAAYYTELLEPVRRLPWKTHDFGFMIFYSYGHGYELTLNPTYKQILLETADSLATMYNPLVGTFESWPWMKRRRNWPHTTIIDNMMNLELLFWAVENGANPQYKEIAERHALKTIEDFVREDHSTCHIRVYDGENPNAILCATDQGLDSTSTWARGHSWATYGFTKAYQYTQDEKFLETAIKLADFYLKHVDADMIPYWDFDAPNTPQEPKDASAAAIMSCAMLDIGRIMPDESEGAKYMDGGRAIVRELSSPHYWAKDRDAFLMNGVGSRPAQSDVTSSLIYADYFYLEALKKLKQLQLPQNERIVQNQ